MIDINFLRENPEKVKESSANKYVNIDVDKVLSLDNDRRKFIQESDELKAVKNKVSKEIGELKKNNENADDKIAEMRDVSATIKELDDKLSATEDELHNILLTIPNIVDDSVPIGKNEDDNKILKQEGEAIDTDKPDHLEIAKKFNLLDFERGAKVTGSGFTFFTGKGAALERALINFFIEENIKKGYLELMPPFIVNEASMTGTGQLPKMAEDMYHAKEDNLYLIPTAEVPFTNYHRDEILNINELTKKVCGYSPCFRREAGSYGKDVRGFLRVHQFNKVELVKFTKPEDSWNELDTLISDVEDLINKLGLTYRVNLLCTGDTSFASSKTIDLEVWSEGEKNWLEVSSCSNFTDFQARRANIRFKRTADSKTEFVHTLNGSGLATPRIIVALLEKCYDGEKIVLPKCLHKYTGFETIEG